MEHVTKIVRAGQWPLARQRDLLLLDYEERHRRRRRFRAEGGLEILLDLAEATVLCEGDGLPLADGSFVAIRAAAEPLIEVRAATPAALARLAWHLGNRHLPAEIGADRILIREDAVILQMLAGLGASARPVSAAFNPEGGAYGQHNIDHRHPHRHDDEQHRQPHSHGRRPHD